MSIEISRHSDEFNCSTCKHRFCDDNNPAPFNKFVVTHNGEKIIDSNTCLKNHTDNDSGFYINLYNHYKNGFLPISGGILDQPNAFHESINLIGSCINDGT